MHLGSFAHCVFITLSMFSLTCEIFCQFGGRKRKPKNFIISKNSNPTLTPKDVISSLHGSLLEYKPNILY